MNIKIIIEHLIYSYLGREENIYTDLSEANKIGIIKK